MRTRDLIVILSILVPGAAAAQSDLHVGGPTFYGPFGIGWQFVGVAVGDVTGDGQPDLALASIGLEAVVVLPGRGGAEFGPPQVIGLGVGHAPNAIVEGDLNADGRLDIAVPITWHNSVAVLLNQGGGAFSAPVEYAVGTQPYELAIADLNNDHVPDLAAVNWVSESVSVLLGLGNGTFAAATSYGVGHGPRSVAIGDLSGDGKPDLAVANVPDDTVSVLRGLGDGSFGAAIELQTWAAPYDVVIADVSGDGINDLLVSCSAMPVGGVSVFLGLDGGGFAPESLYSFGSLTIAVATGDLDGDGIPDLVTANIDSHDIALVKGLGGGEFGAVTSIAIDEVPSSVALGDFNGDGTLDVAATVPDSGGRACVLLNHGPSGNPWSFYGFGLAGTDGIPNLSAAGPQTAGGPVFVTLTGARPSALAGFFISISNHPTPFKGGMLVPVPVGLTLVVVTDGLGSFQLMWPNWPAGVPSGLPFYVQYAIQDPAAANGVALSNALQVLAP